MLCCNSSTCVDGKCEVCSQDRVEYVIPLSWPSLFNSIGEMSPFPVSTAIFCLLEESDVDKHLLTTGEETEVAVNPFLVLGVGVFLPGVARGEGDSLRLSATGTEKNISNYIAIYFLQRYMPLMYLVFFALVGAGDCQNL